MLIIKDNPINSFTGKYRFLSNFGPSSVEFGGKIYATVEHAYQGAKTFDLEEREDIRLADTPGKAKRLGKKATIRADWDDVKLSIMEDLVRQKFSKHASLKEKLLETNNAELVKGNYWGDVFWGVCKGVGKNHLGKILMKIREELFVEQYENDETV